MKHILLHYLDYCNCTQPFTLTIDYLRVRFPTTDALEIIKNVLAMKANILYMKIMECLVMKNSISMGILV